MSPRAEIVNLLLAGVPSDWDVRSYDAELANLQDLTVTVQHTDITAPVTFGQWAATVVVDVVSPYQRYDVAEAQLEDALADTMGVLTASLPQHLFTSAERIVRAEKYQAWRITLSVPTSLTPNEE